MCRITVFNYCWLPCYLQLGWPCLLVLLLRSADGSCWFARTSLALTPPLLLLLLLPGKRALKGPAGQSQHRIASVMYGRFMSKATSCQDSLHAPRGDAWKLG